MRDITILLTSRIVPKKNSFRAGVSRSGRKFQYRTRSAKTSEEALIWEMQAFSSRMAWKPFVGPVQVTIRLRKTRADLVGLVETILDALQGGHGKENRGLIVKDDKQVARLYAEWDQDWDKDALPKCATARVSIRELP